MEWTDLGAYEILICESIKMIFTWILQVGQEMFYSCLAFVS